MEIQIKSHTTEESRYVAITKITPIQTGPLIIGVKTTFNVNGEQCPFYEFFPVLFVGAFQLGNAYSENIIGYFFINNDKELQVHAPGDLDDGKEYIYDPYGCELVNYDGYCKLCEQTGETKLSLIDYFERKDGLVTPNSVVVYKNEIYHGEKMGKLFRDFPN